MIVLDIETSGLDPRIHSILSLGALDSDEPTNQFYDECRLWDGAEVDPDSLAINGFTETEINDHSKKTEGELLAAFIAWATDRPENRTLVAHNPAFDRDFLKAACRRAGVAFPFAERTVDTHTLCWLHMTTHGLTPPVARHHSAINLDFALRYCGMEDEPRPHNALTGALSHAEVFSRIAYTKKLLPDFSSFDIPWH